jgi:hypothetical protein
MVYRVSFVSIDDVFMWICEVLYAICSCYPWEIALNVGLDVSLDNMQDWKGI